MRKQIPANKTKAVIEFSKLKPKERLNMIRQGLEVRIIPQAKSLWSTFMERHRF
jgi:hypothetical protein